MTKGLFFFLLVAIIAVAVVQFAAGFREQWAESRYPPTGQIIDVDGVDVHAEIFGDGPDLILIHGASGSSRDFTFSLAEALQTRYRVVVFDRPGLGWTERPDGFGGALETTGESPRLQADLLRKAAGQIGVERPLLLGHSYGGSVAMAWALDDPDTAAVIMVAAASHPWPGDLHWQYPISASPAGSATFVPLVAAFTPSFVIERVIGSLFHPQATPEGYRRHVGPSLSLRRSSQRANARQVNSLRPHLVRMAEEYPRLTLPIEIVHGDADTIVPLEVHSRPLAERVRSANLKILKGVGHMPHHVAQDDVIAAIDRAAARAGLR